ncbi:hypothetical protein [Methylobacterium bullatum]|uniref:Uncharacterized protein n=1 Tax=Methylobacterium bullatum TaxID=570505 RepID=A0A679K8H4_9HYPH|nr:hypothetical protein [Methylobacterium bullatum]GJD40218.1 hypothetical protein OICFNHDK_2684 [Methylobacterium bullatum]CAA2140953.1 hypothetical protein MBLL_02385 [Methylobacterium bullatum]
MTTIKKIKGLAKSLLDRNTDLVAAGRNSFWLLPVGPVGRLIHLDRTSNPAYCVAGWYLVEFFMPGVRSSSSLGRCSGRIARSEGFEGGQGWFWSDPTIYDDFVTRVEEDALAILRPLDTTRGCLDFARTRPATVGRLGLDWHLVSCIALGELDEARAIWSKMGKQYRKGAVMEDAHWQLINDRTCLIGEPLMANDRAALATLLHRWEAETIVGSPLEPFWRPSPFPLEDNASAGR